jgi:hypothetical protein
MTDPTEARAALDTAIADALPLAGSHVRKRLKQLRRALNEVDEMRRRNRPTDSGPQSVAPATGAQPSPITPRRTQ